MSICGPMALGPLVVAVRMRRGGRTMPRAAHMARRIRSILLCRNRKRGRFMTTVRGRSARLPGVPGRRGRLAISLGDARLWAAAVTAALPLSGALHDVAQRGRIPRRCAYSQFESRDDGEHFVPNRTALSVFVDFNNAADRLDALASQ